MEEYDIKDYETFVTTMKDIIEKMIVVDYNIKFKLYVQCENIENTYMITEIVVESMPLSDTIIANYYYNVYHYSTDELYIKKIFMKNEIEKVIEFFFELCWNYKLCPECIHLINKENSLCENCMFHKLRQEYGIKKGYKISHESCMICKDVVYNTQLACGHYIHQTCLLQLNPKKWFEKNIEIKCGICRQSITEYDINKYFYN